MKIEDVGKMQVEIKSWHYDKKHDHLVVSFTDSSNSFCIGDENGMDFFAEPQNGELTGIDFWDFIATYPERFSKLTFEWKDLGLVYHQILWGRGYEV